MRSDFPPWHSVISDLTPAWELSRASHARTEDTVYWWLKENGASISDKGFLCGSAGKESACKVGDLGSIPQLGRSPREGNGNGLQYSCLENSMDRGAGQVAVHGIAKTVWLTFIFISDKAESHGAERQQKWKLTPILSLALYTEFFKSSMYIMDMDFTNSVTVWWSLSTSVKEVQVSQDERTRTSPSCNIVNKFNRFQVLDFCRLSFC